MPLPKSLTTVTTFSKWLALSMFIIIPIVSFYYGIYYQQQQKVHSSNADLTANWKTYTGTGELKDGNPFSIKYPPTWTIVDNKLYPYGESKGPYYSPIFELGIGGFDFDMSKKKDFPAGTAVYMWRDNQDSSVGVADFPVGTNSYLIIRANNIPLKESKTMEQTFNQMLETLVILTPTPSL